DAGLAGGGAGAAGGPGSGPGCPGGERGGDVVVLRHGPAQPPRRRARRPRGDQEQDEVRKARPLPGRPPAAGASDLILLRDRRARAVALRGGRAFSRLTARVTESLPRGAAEDPSAPGTPIPGDSREGG